MFRPFSSFDALYKRNILDIYSNFNVESFPLEVSE